jgi:hypothetical protein
VAKPFDEAAHPRADDGKFRDKPLTGADAATHLEGTHVAPDDSQAAALQAYSGLSFNPIQALLRGRSGNIPLDMDKVNARLNEFMQSANHLDTLVRSQKPTTHSVETWRGVDTTGLPPGALAAMQPGKELSDAGFSSTSVDPTQARFFTGKDALMLRVRLPEGSRVFYRGDAEREAVLPRGARFHIYGRQDNVDFGNSRTGTLLDIEYLPDAT